MTGSARAEYTLASRGASLDSKGLRIKHHQKRGSSHQNALHDRSPVRTGMSAQAQERAKLQHVPHRWLFGKSSDRWWMRW
jgi:hypothetical protein